MKTIKKLTNEIEQLIYEAKILQCQKSKKRLRKIRKQLTRIIAEYLDRV